MKLTKHTGLAKAQGRESNDPIHLLYDTRRVMELVHISRRFFDEYDTAISIAFRWPSSSMELIIASDEDHAKYYEMGTEYYFRELNVNHTWAELGLSIEEDRITAEFLDIATGTIILFQLDPLHDDQYNIERLEEL